MRLRKISLLNFRCFDEASIDDLATLNLFAGGNGAGKSTVLDAISVALTGSCRGAESGRGLPELRKAGSQRRWLVALDAVLDGGEACEFVRTEGQGPGSDVQRDVERQLALDGRQIRACLSSGELLRSGKAEAQRLILDLAKPESIELPVRIRELLAKHGGAPDGPVTLPAIERSYERAYARRTEAGRELRALGDPIVVEVPPGLEDVDDEQLRILQQTIADSIEGLRGERREKAAAADEAAAGPERYARRLRLARENLAALTTEQDDPQQITARLRDVVRQVKDATEARKLVAAKTANLQQRIATLAGELGQAEKLLGVADGATKGQLCGVCGSKLTAEKARAAREKLQNERDATEREHSRLSLELRAIADGDTSAADLARLDAEQIDLEGRSRRYQQRAQEIEAATAAVSALEAETPQAAEAEPHAAEIAALDERIATGTGKLETIIAYRGRLSAAARHEAQRRVLATTHAELDQLVEALGPEGVRKDAASSDGVGQFVGSVTSLLHALGFTGVDLGPVLRMEGPPLVFGREARLGPLSRSQVERFGVAFQIAVASWTQLGLVCIDDFEMFEPAVQQQVQQMLAASGHQAFIGQVLRDREAFLAAAAETNAGDEMRLYLVESGRIVREEVAA